MTDDPISAEVPIPEPPAVPPLWPLSRGPHRRRWPWFLVGILTVLAVIGAFVAGKEFTGSPSTADRLATHHAHAQTESTTTAPAASFASLYQEDSTGVVRITATTCGGSGVGTGFLLSPTLVATAAHVVDGAAAVDLTAGESTRPGHVVGIDTSTDVALVQTTSPINGHVFILASTLPTVGTTLGIIGYPEGGPQSFTQGVVSGLNRTIDVAGIVRSNMIQTDAPVDPGNSGGPMLTLNDKVVGLVDAGDTSAQGLAYGVPATNAGPLLASWEAIPAPPPAPSCATPLGPGTPGSVGSNASSPDAEGIIGTLTTFFDAIDNGDYVTAYAQFTPAGQTLLGSEGNYAFGLASSYFFNITVESINQQTPGVDVATVDFTSVQNPSTGPSGDSCDDWNLGYTMVDTNGVWLIYEANGVPISCG
jgi:serine protease Do